MSCALERGIRAWPAFCTNGSMTMVADIGRRPRGEGLVDLLLACHERIREHTRLAIALGTPSDVSPSEVIEVCLRCERRGARQRAAVLTAAEPLGRDFEEHLRMEEQIIFPAIATLSPRSPA